MQNLAPSNSGQINEPLELVTPVRIRAGLLFINKEKKIMRKLTVQIAKKIFRHYTLKIKDKDQKRFIFNHVEAVVETSKLLAKYTEADVKTLEIAGWVHDIGKSADREPHAEESLKILEKDFFVSEILKDCILNHGYLKHPKTIEGKILQSADKISILDRKILPIFLKNQNKSFNLDYLDMLEKITSQSMSLLKNYNSKSGKI